MGRQRSLEVKVILIFYWKFSYFIIRVPRLILSINNNDVDDFQYYWDNILQQSNASSSKQIIPYLNKSPKSSLKLCFPLCRHSILQEHLQQFSKSIRRRPTSTAAEDVLKQRKTYKVEYILLKRTKEISTR